MVYEVEDKKMIESLFKGWEETMIWSCLQDYMGKAFCDNLDEILKSKWAGDLCSQFHTYDEYEKHGMGAVILKSGEIVSGASSYTVYKDGIEIEIDTRQDERRKGLALCCGAKLILECLDRNLYPSWDAQNKGSLALAEKLGYKFDHTYTAYFFS